MLNRYLRTTKIKISDGKIRKEAAGIAKMQRAFLQAGKQKGGECAVVQRQHAGREHLVPRNHKAENHGGCHARQRQRHHHFHERLKLGAAQVQAASSSSRGMPMNSDDDTRIENGSARAVCTSATPAACRTDRR
jgi:hypothetical protein